MLDVTGLRPAFSAVVSLDDITNGKPHPEPYLRAAELLDVAPSELVVLEDTDIGVTSAKAAGAYVVGITRTLGAKRMREADELVGPGRRRPRRATVLVIAHRGASAELPENTLPAFERAIEIGADYVEFDVWNGLEVTHAPPEHRGSYPTLAEVIELCRGRIGLMVELKRPRGDTVERALRLLDGRRCRRLVPAARDRGDAPPTPEAPDRPARRLRGVDPPRPGRLGGRVPGSARHAPRDRSGAGARARDDRLHRQRRRSDARAARPRRDRRLHRRPGRSLTSARALGPLADVRQRFVVGQRQ